jgi:hypothetical protein
MSRSIRTISDKDLAVDQLQQAIISSHHNNFPAKTTGSPRKVPGWNKKLSGLTAKTRRPFNTGKRTCHWAAYKEVLTCYNKETWEAK